MINKNKFQTAAKNRNRCRKRKWLCRGAAALLSLFFLCHAGAMQISAAGADGAASELTAQPTAGTDSVLTAQPTAVTDSVMTAQPTAGTDSVMTAQSAAGTAAEISLPAWPAAPTIVGESGIVMEVSTGTILYSKSMHAQYYPASITKILTALLVLENCELDEWVTIPYDAVYMDEDKGSHVALDVDEEVRVKDLLYALMLASANDAAHALAVHVGGSIEGFAEMMNQKTAELGCKNSYFVNPHGLPNDAQLTSAYDMALITREALKSEVFREIAGTLFYEIPPSEKQPDLIPMSQHHDMLTGTRYHYDGAFVGKTGYTTIAKNTLVTCAAREGMELICVTMKTEGKQVYKDTAALFDYGFENFKLLDIAENLPASISAEMFADAVAAKETDVDPSEMDLEDGLGKKRSDITKEIWVSEKNSDTAGEILLKDPQIRRNENVVIPESASFEQLRLQIHYDENRREADAPALLTFSYGERTVGSAVIDLPQELVEVPQEVSAQPTVPQEAEAAETEKDEEAAGFRWWYIPLGLLILILLIGGGLTIRRAIWMYRWRKRRRQKYGRRSGRSGRFR